MTLQEKEELRDLIFSAVAEATAPLLDEVIYLRETLGERSLTVRQMQEMNGGRPSDQTFRRRISDGLIHTVSEHPIRVLYSEFKRARDAGLL